jgi:hypothetical protein
MAHDQEVMGLKPVYWMDVNDDAQAITLKEN